MSINLDPDVLTDNGPGLTGATIVAAMRGIAVNQAREQLLIEWDMRVAKLIEQETATAQMWLGYAQDLTDIDPERARDNAQAGMECMAAVHAYQAKRTEAAHMIRAVRENYPDSRP